MKISHSVAALDSASAWSRLARVLGGQDLDVVRNTIRHLRVLDAKCYVLEDPYIDRDYSADYAQFYALTFHTHERHCKRVHFFSRDISLLVQRPISTVQLSDLGELAKDAYCGFCVIRPLSAAPIGRTVLLARVGKGFDIEATVTCRADIDAHLLGTRLQVTGTSFLQQDSRVGACAQVAIWVGMRHMHAQHHYNWVSVADITRFAGPPSVTEAVSLPNASDRLSSDAMVRASQRPAISPSVFRVSTSATPYSHTSSPAYPSFSALTSAARSATPSPSSGASSRGRRIRPPVHSTTSPPGDGACRGSRGDGWRARGPRRLHAESRCRG